MIYSEVAPTGQRMAIGMAELGLADRVAVMSVQRGQLVSIDDGRYQWQASQRRRAYELLERVAGVRLPCLCTDDGAIVSNDPFQTLAALAGAAPRSGRDLYPAACRDEQYRWTERLFYELHAGVYRAGFLNDQAAYDKQVAQVEGFLGDVNTQLRAREFLAGDTLTDADIWLFCLLVRFDQVYAPGFRLHRYRLRDFPSISAYMRALYARPLFSVTTNFPVISSGYFRGIPALDRGITPLGPDDHFLTTERSIT